MPPECRADAEELVRLDDKVKQKPEADRKHHQRQQCAPLFAAQVLAVLKLMEDAEFCRERLGRKKPVGRIDPDRLNAWGGSLSVGHPFGATGARLVTTCAQRMKHEDARHGLLAACAGGGLGIGMVLERS